MGLSIELLEINRELECVRMKLVTAQEDFSRSIYETKLGEEST